MPNSDQGTTVMNGPTDSTTARPWKEILTAFLKLGATSYGGPAMMGIMQAELQGKRKWVSKERFVEGLAVANMVPGATATQLAILSLAKTSSGSQVVDQSPLMRPSFQLDDLSPNPPASASPLALWRPPPVGPRESGRASTARRV